MPESDQSRNHQNYIRKEYPSSETTARIIAAAQEVHRVMGPGFEEVFYQRALALEFSAQNLEFDRESWIEVHYKGQILGRKRVDFIVEGVLVEIKARSAFLEPDFVQTLSYLKASGFQVALLLNFGAKSFEIKRLVNTKTRPEPPNP